MFKLHGVRFIKGIKIFESMLKNLPLVVTKLLGISSQDLIAVVLICAVLRY